MDTESILSSGEDLEYLATGAEIIKYPEFGGHRCPASIARGRSHMGTPGDPLGRLKTARLIAVDLDHDSREMIGT